MRLVSDQQRWPSGTLPLDRKRTACCVASSVSCQCEAQPVLGHRMSQGVGIAQLHLHRGTDSMVCTVFEVWWCVLAAPSRTAPCCCSMLPRAASATEHQRCAAAHIVTPQPCVPSGVLLCCSRCQPQQHAYHHTRKSYVTLCVALLQPVPAAATATQQQGRQAGRRQLASSAGPSSGRAPAARATGSRWTGRAPRKS